MFKIPSVLIVKVHVSVSSYSEPSPVNGIIRSKSISVNDATSIDVLGYLPILNLLALAINAFGFLRICF